MPFIQIKDNIYINFPQEYYKNLQEEISKINITRLLINFNNLFLQIAYDNSQIIYLSLWQEIKIRNKMGKVIEEISNKIYNYGKTHLINTSNNPYQLFIQSLKYIKEAL